jgi:hypothetical protein
MLQIEGVERFERRRSRPTHAWKLSCCRGWRDGSLQDARRPGRYDWRVTPVTWKYTPITPEHWQFFAFVSAALLTLAYAIQDALGCWWGSWCTPWLTISGKVIMFVVLAWLTLWCWWCKYRLIRLLETITTKTQLSS